MPALYESPLDIPLETAKAIYRRALEPNASDGEGEAWWAAVAAEVVAAGAEEYRRGGHHRVVASRLEPGGRYAEGGSRAFTPRIPGPFAPGQQVNCGEFPTCKDAGFCYPSPVRCMPVPACRRAFPTRYDHGHES